MVWGGLVCYGVFWGCFHGLGWIYSGISLYLNCTDFMPIVD